MIRAASLAETFAFSSAFRRSCSFARSWLCSLIRLPPKTVLQASEQNLLAGGSYPVFSFYSPLYSPAGGPAIVPHPPQMPYGSVRRLRRDLDCRT